MANEQNLRPIPMNLRSKEEVKKIAAKGGRANKNNPKSKLAARLRELKKKGMTDEAAKRIYEIFEDPNISALDIWLYLEKIKQTCTNANQMTQVADKFIQLHKAHHGEKSRNENLNVNVNIDMLKFNELIKKYQKEEEN